LGLYLAIFQSEEIDEEIEGVECGGYKDFSWFRSTVIEQLEAGNRGSRFPTLLLHSDCDGHWTPEDASLLLEELTVISQETRNLPPIPFNSDWQQDIAHQVGLHPKSLFECFIDVDGEFLLDRLADLARICIERSLPIEFQ